MSARDQVATGDPDNAAVLLALGALLAQQGRAVDARALLLRAVALRPDLSAAHVSLGNVQRRLGQTQQAIASYRTATRLEPGSAVAHYNLGNACAASGGLDEAAAAFERAIAARPGWLAALDGLGSVRSIQRRFAEALRCFAAIASADAAFPGVAYHTGVARQGLGDEAGAAEAFREALRREPDRGSAQNNLCIALLRSGAPDQALVESERYLARWPASLPPLAYQAAALIALGRRDAARAVLDFDRLIVEREIAPPAGYRSLAAFNDALATELRHNRSLRYEPPDRSTRGGSQTGELLTGTGGPAAALGAAIRSAVQAYLDHVRAVLPEHPYAARLPARWRLATWGVVLDSHGYQGPHFHPDGRISGVYYVRLPSAVDAGRDHAGWIEFGRTGEALGGTGDPLLELRRPRAGAMLLFPSYFYHRTLPFEASEPRISVAFDVLPAP